MKIIKNLIMPIIVFCCLPLQLAAQNQYNDYKSMVRKIQSLSGRSSAVCSVRSLAKTAGGKEIWVISIGSGNKDSKPGIAIFGGLREAIFLAGNLPWDLQHHCWRSIITGNKRTA